MKRCLIKMVLIIGISLVFKIDSFALNLSTFGREESATSYGYSQISSQIVLNQAIDLQNVKVKFTQNDDNYIFHVTGNSVIYVYRDFGGAFSSSYTNAPVPLLYKKENFGDGLMIDENSKSPFADYKSGNLYTNSGIGILSTTIAYFNSSYTLKSDGSRTNIVREQWDNGEKYYVPNSLRNRASARSYNFSSMTNFPCNCNNNGTGVSILQNSSNHQYSFNDVNIGKTKCIETLTININCKISIKKDYIDDYKYVCFAQSYAFLSDQSVLDLAESATGISICTQTIDLKEHVDCAHEWSMMPKDRSNHKLYCNKCEWEKTTPHELLYEYDGIKNNVCTCSYIDKVNYHFKINDDNINELTALLDSNSPYTKYEFTSKKGYKFKYYKKYEKKLESLTDLSTVSNAISTEFIATCSELDDETGNYSVIYEAKYDANLFTFMYSNLNNKSIELNSTIEPQKIYYDEKAYLKKNAKLTGYAFKGWSLILGSDKIDFEPKQEITNYTDIDLSEITIYPVYKNLDFKIAYSSGKGTFEDGTKYKEIEYTYFDNSKLESITINSSEDYLKCYIDQNGNMFYTMAEVKKYIDDNELDNFILKLSPIITRNGQGSPERTDDERIDDNIKETVRPNSEPGVVEDNPDGSIIVYEYSGNAGIHGMSASTKDDGDKKKDAMFGAVVATLSFIRKPNVNDKDSYYKLRLLLLFIKEHLIFASVCASLLILLIIIYEIIIINHYKKRV